VDDATRHVLLVGYEDRDNLGLRYLLACLEQHGWSAEIWKYDRDVDALVARARARRPLLVGFSLIFQYMAPDFGAAIAALRRAGVDAHVTVGGHYPSFEPAEVLAGIEGLDSVVRFEGEQTLLELVEALRAGADWRAVPGLSFRDGDGVGAAPPRPAIEDLDALPWPSRASFDYESERLPTAAVLGSRGCPWDCTFCSIRPFYEAQGPLRRYRQPRAIVAEMRDLFERRGVRLFLFQDDDFLGGGRRARRWAGEIADAILEAGLGGRVAWKISCRSDEIDEETFAHLARGGLTHVYMGVEAGDPDDLADMRKRMTPEAHLEAGRILRRLGLSFDFGFMLLQPYSTLARVRNNVRFLRELAGDGYAIAGFCRMLPYAGTPIRDRLAAEGRLGGTPFQPDYRFLDPKLDLFYDWMVETFHERNFTSRGLNQAFRAALFEARLRLPGAALPEPARRLLQHLAAVCNQVAFYTLEAALDHVEAMPLEALRTDRRVLAELAAHEAREEERLAAELSELFQWATSDAAGRREPVGAFERTWTHAGRGAAGGALSARTAAPASPA